MLIKIENVDELEKLQNKTGITIEQLVNDIIEVHLNDRKRKEALERNLGMFFSLYMEKCCEE